MLNVSLRVFRIILLSLMFNLKFKKHSQRMNYCFAADLPHKRPRRELIFAEYSAGKWLREIWGLKSGAACDERSILSAALTALFSLLENP